MPGQYVQIKVKDADKPGFFAISSPPTSDGILEFLIKASLEVLDWFEERGGGEAEGDQYHDGFDSIRLNRSHCRRFACFRFHPMKNPDEIALSIE